MELDILRSIKKSFNTGKSRMAATESSADRQGKKGQRLPGAL